MIKSSYDYKWGLTVRGRCVLQEEKALHDEKEAQMAREVLRLPRFYGVCLARSFQAGAPGEGENWKERAGEATC